MNKITVLKGIITSLILLNFVLIVKVFTKPSDRPFPPKNDAEAMTRVNEIFGFDEQQIEQFKVSRAKHFEAMENLKPKLTEASLSYYTSIGSSNKIDSLFAIADQYNDAIYIANRKHFDEIRSICTPDQLSKMNQFIIGLLDSKKRQE